jgi:hypothetical protein
MGRGRTTGWRRLETIIKEGGISLEGPRVVRVPCARALTKALGHKLAGIKLLPNLTHRPEEVTKAVVREIAADDVPMAISLAVAEHNRQLGKDPRSIFLCLTQQSGMRLCARLETIARQAPEQPRPRITTRRKSRKIGPRKKFSPHKPVRGGLTALQI